jgi:hypothetical protein
VTNNNGDRNLIILEYHPETPGRREVYIPFLRRLAAILRQAGILGPKEALTLFMEDVYTVRGQSDPYFLCLNDEATILRGKGLSLKGLIASDPDGYYALVNDDSFRVVGIEDRQLFQDGLRLIAIHKCLPKLYDSLYRRGQRDDSLEAKVNSLAKSLETTYFPEHVYPDEMGEPERKLLELSQTAMLKTTRTRREKQFARVINESSKAYGTYGLLLRAVHLFPDERFRKYGTLQDHLKGIDWIYVKAE